MRNLGSGCDNEYWWNIFWMGYDEVLTLLRNSEMKSFR